MKKLALLSAALLVVTLAGFAGTIVKSKSNITNNREAMCHANVVHDPDGKLRLECSPCPDGKPCEVHTVPDGHGGTRSWCGCTKEEPKECHPVLHTVEGKTRVECSAATLCEKPKTCKPVETKSGITCDCQ